MKRLMMTAGILFLIGQSAFAVTTEEIIDAFMRDEAVQTEIRMQRDHIRGDREEVQVVDLGRQCGVVGCYFYKLVIMKITRETVNPQTGTVLARIDGLHGKIEKVTLVELSPKRSKETFNIQKRYSAPAIRLERVR